jgi:hypothetical protein
MLLPRLAKDRSLRITTAFLGVYAGLIAIQHGIFEILQGSRAPDGLMFNAIGPPCQPEAVWHACFPAMTLIPEPVRQRRCRRVGRVGMAIWATASCRAPARRACSGSAVPAGAPGRRRLRAGLHRAGRSGIASRGLHRPACGLASQFWPRSGPGRWS